LPFVLLQLLLLALMFLLLFDMMHCLWRIQVAFVGNTAQGGGGGAVYLGPEGSLLAYNCTFTNNRAEAGASSTTAFGGATYVTGPAEIELCTFSNNSAAAFGGALCIEAENVTVTDNVFDSNSARAAGGSIFNVLNVNESQKVTELQPPQVPLLSNNSFSSSSASCCYATAAGPQPSTCADIDYKTDILTQCCGVGFYIDAEGCQPCTDELSCSTVGTDIRSLERAPGLWRPQLDSLQTFECYSKAACSGGSSSGSADDYCSTGYTGPCKLCL
jgi:Chlamydia polymorphic membrane protein (Chlamydia_PMP) repeat